LTLTPSISFKINAWPLILRQCFSACRLKTIVSVAVLEPHPFVRLVRSRTVAKVDSIGLVVRM
jgi:hypothetical protein